MIKKMCQSCGKILNRENKSTLDNGFFLKTTAAVVFRMENSQKY